MMFSFDCNECKRKGGNQNSNGIPNRSGLRYIETRKEQRPSESVGIPKER